MTLARLRAAIVGANDDALRAIDVEARVRAAVARELRGGDRAHVIAIGKAAPAMMRGALAALGDPVDALCVVPDGVDARGVTSRIERAGHPLPDARSVRAAALAFDVARAAARSRGVLVALVSGGASALVCAPFRTTLARKVDAVHALIHARATIAEINVVRRHASRIKGGGLARAAGPARVVTIVVSDVIGGAPFDVGSGPTLADPTTRKDARAVLARHGVASIPLRASFRDVPRGVARVVASPEDFASVARVALAARGLRARSLPARSTDVAWFAASYVALARRLAPGEAVVRAAEPTIAVARAGKGGRCAHLAALVAASLPDDVVFMAAASDGVDGASGAAGAIVDLARWSRLAPSSVASALARFDSGRLHARARTALRGGPTGQNFADLHVLARLPR